MRIDTVHVKARRGQPPRLMALETLLVSWEKGRELEVTEGKYDVEGNGRGRMEKEGQADPFTCLGYDSHEGNKTSVRWGWSLRP